ncbi:MAG: hypothetical protein J4G03_03440 [Gemmatimonadetes bacterium]|nr:hypothetical protein [Gemmatimonadota bacterium]
MTDRTLLTLLIIPLVLSFVFGIWVGLGFPGIPEHKFKKGRVSRTPPVGWLPGAGVFTSRSSARMRAKDPVSAETSGDDGDEIEVRPLRKAGHRPKRADFSRGRRFR